MKIIGVEDRLRGEWPVMAAISGTVQPASASLIIPLEREIGGRHFYLEVSKGPRGDAVDVH